MRGFFVESYRVLKAGGTTIHSFLSPKPRNGRQRRLIEADSDPRWTKTPPTEWFSPPPRLVLEYLRLAGFKRPMRARLRSGLVIRSTAARELLKDWDIRASPSRSTGEGRPRDSRLASDKRMQNLRLDLARIGSRRSGPGPRRLSGSLGSFSSREENGHCDYSYNDDCNTYPHGQRNVQYTHWGRARGAYCYLDGRGV